MATSMFFLLFVGLACILKPQPLRMFESNHRGKTGGKFQHDRVTVADID